MRARAIWCHGAIASHPARVAASQRTRPGFRSGSVRRRRPAGQASAGGVEAVPDNATGQQPAAAVDPDRAAGGRRCWDLTIDIDDRIAEYDRDLEHYIPIEQIAAEYPEELARLASGHLPSTVDEDAFLARINDGIRDIAAAADHEDTVAVFSHGGVINGLLHSILRTEKILCVNVDYAGVTRLLSSRDGNLYVASVNGTEHVWDLLPEKSAVVDKSGDNFAGRARPRRAGPPPQVGGHSA